MLIKSFCICICRIRIRLFAHLWTVACAHPWISPISSTPRPNLRQRMGIIVKWKSFLRKELLVHNFFSVHMHIPPLVSRIFCTYFCKHFCLTSHDKKLFLCVFRFFDMLWYVQFSLLHPPFFTRSLLFTLINAIISNSNWSHMPTT